MGVCAAGWVAWFPAGDPSSLMMVGVGDEAGRGGGEVRRARENAKQRSAQTAPVSVL
jgi:hypothetical protein